MALESAKWFREFIPGLLNGPPAVEWEFCYPAFSLRLGSGSGSGCRGRVTGTTKVNSHHQTKGISWNLLQPGCYIRAFTECTLIGIKLGNWEERMDGAYSQITTQQTRILTELDRNSVIMLQLRFPPFSIFFHFFILVTFSTFWEHFYEASTGRKMSDKPTLDKPVITDKKMVKRWQVTYLKSAPKR